MVSQDIYLLTENRRVVRIPSLLQLHFLHRKLLLT